MDTTRLRPLKKNEIHPGPWWVDGSIWGLHGQFIPILALHQISPSFGYDFVAEFDTSKLSVEVFHNLHRCINTLNFNTSRGYMVIPSQVFVSNFYSDGLENWE